MWYFQKKKNLKKKFPFPYLPYFPSSWPIVLIILLSVKYSRCSYVYFYSWSWSCYSTLCYNYSRHSWCVSIQSCIRWWCFWCVATIYIVNFRYWKNTFFSYVVNYCWNFGIFLSSQNPPIKVLLSRSIFVYIPYVPGVDILWILYL